jgi:hypothetical protein
MQSQVLKFETHKCTRLKEEVRLKVRVALYVQNCNHPTNQSTQQKRNASEADKVGSNHQPGDYKAMHVFSAKNPIRYPSNAEFEFSP